MHPLQPSLLSDFIDFFYIVGEGISTMIFVGLTQNTVEMVFTLGSLLLMAAWGIHNTFKNHTYKIFRKR
jgi:hypothetical protein